MIKLQTVFTQPTYEQAILHAHLYDDVRIQVKMTSIDDVVK